MIQQALISEVKKNYDLAESLWRQVITAAQSTPSDRVEATEALERIWGERRRLITPNYQIEPELKSEKGVDYRKLRNLLAEGKWKEADKETGKVMCQAAGRTSEGEGWLRGEDIDNFPCEDLRTINQLWLHYSNGKFGFSVQKKIYESLGGTREYNNKEVWEKFGDRVGWREGDWLYYSSLIWNLELAPQAHLPSHGVFGGVWGVLVVWFGVGGHLFSRAKTCNL